MTGNNHHNAHCCCGCNLRASKRNFDSTFVVSVFNCFHVGNLPYRRLYVNYKLGVLVNKLIISF